MYCCSCQSSFEPVQDCDCECHGLAVAALVDHPEFQHMLSVRCPPADSSDADHQADWAGAGDLLAFLRLSSLAGLKLKMLPTAQLPGVYRVEDSLEV